MSTVAERKKYDIAAIQREQGLKCPECHCRDLRVVWTEPMGNRIKRHRYCRHCGHGPIVSWEESAQTSEQLGGISAENA